MLKRLRLLVAAALVMVCVAPLYAQGATPSSLFVWTIGAPDLATASAYTYRHYPDNAAVGITLTGVTCSGTVAPFTCQATVPAFTPGAHTDALTAGNAAGESPKTAAISFTMVLVPNTPGAFRIQ